MSATKKYWNSLEHLQEDPDFIKKSHSEFSEEIPVDEFLGKTQLDSTSTSRRDFLKFLGFSVSAATLAACETPITKAIPYVVKPEEITPGIANYYASTYYDGNDYCSVLVKTREGRPIHIEGNKLSSITKGGVNARVNSSVLSLYDSHRLKTPLTGNKETSWSTADSEIKSKLTEIASREGKIVLLSGSIISPSTQMIISDFKAKFSSANTTPETTNVSHIVYDALSYSGMLTANESSFGKAQLPDYKFEKAKTIVSIGADFLSNWLSSIEYSVGYGSRRKPDGEWMSKHYQFETGMSLTGSNADVRIAIKPSEHSAVAVALFNELAKKADVPTVTKGEIAEDNQNIVAKISDAANRLWNTKGESLVVAGSNDKSVQTIVNAINSLLGNYGKTLDFSSALKLKQGEDFKVKTLLSEMSAGKIDAILVLGTDPAYSMPLEWGFKDAISKVGLKISFASKANLTSELCDYVCPDNHYLESWNDANPKEGYYSLTQPVINKLFDTRQAQESLMTWAGIDGSYMDYMKSAWEKYGFSRQTKYITFTEYWSNSLHDGVSEVTMPPADLPEFKGDVLSAASSISSIKGGSWELELYTKTGIGDGNQAHNPWLQELPDPITKVTWDNYITMNPVDMMDAGYPIKIAQETPAGVAKVTSNGKEITLPVFPMPGQKRKTVGIALGYGKAKIGEEYIGKNAFPFVTENNGNLCYSNYDVMVERVEGTYPIASSQTHHTMMGRKIVNETTLEIYKGGNKEDYNASLLLTDSYGDKKTTRELNLWDDHDIERGHRWGMSIDLNTCTGCSACVTACSSENNVPVVGKDEVRRTRTMFWLRIDRYFSSDMSKEVAKTDDVGTIDMYRKMEIPSEYPQVVHQPLMCQHCNHAPCETVCPVAATTHSTEGLNQMAYNRCVGTRYCANNCPYKVRRFNWFQYDRKSNFTAVNPSQDDYGRMVLNPDVVVRSRGVIEKCSMCIQRIQTGKLDAKKKGKKVEDGAIQTACSSACPTNAITFGDLNDTTSVVNKNLNDDRAYFLIEEVGTQPNITYLTKVRNVENQTV